MGARIELRNMADIVRVFSAAARVHDLRDVHQVLRNVAFLHSTSLTEAIVCTRETAVNAANQPLVSWRSSYLMARKNGIWRLTHVNATNHDEAWKARGEKPLHAAAESSLC